MTTSLVDYNGWKKRVRDYYSSYGDRYVNSFINFISSRYDKHQRNYLNSKLIWRLFDIHNKVLKNQHQVYGCFGRGGYGKSTLIKNVLYLHDPTFNQSRIATSMDQFDEILLNVLELKNPEHKAILIDEPSKEEHSSSKKWRLTEDVLGQIRARNLFLGICATKLDNVKPGLYSMITGLFAFRKYFIYDYYDEEKTEGITGKIWKKYQTTNTYECFSENEIFKMAYLKNFRSLKSTPIDHEEKLYEEQKKRAFLAKLRKLAEQRKIEKEGLSPKERLHKRIYEKYKTGKFKQSEIAKYEGVSTRTIIRIIKHQSDKMTQ